MVNFWMVNDDKKSNFGYITVLNSTQLDYNFMIKIIFLISLLGENKEKL